MRRLLSAAILAVASGISAHAYAQDSAGLDGPTDVLRGRPYSPYADRAFPTNVYFGDTHVHTGLSADAGGSGTRLMPRDAYLLARGEQVTSNTGQPLKLDRPYDLFMITVIRSTSRSRAGPILSAHRNWGRSGGTRTSTLRSAPSTTPA